MECCALQTTRVFHSEAAIVSTLAVLRRSCDSYRTPIGKNMKWSTFRYTFNVIVGPGRYRRLKAVPCANEWETRKGELRCIHALVPNVCTLETSNTLFSIEFSLSTCSCSINSDCEALERQL